MISGIGITNLVEDQKKSLHFDSTSFFQKQKTCKGPKVLLFHVFCVPFIRSEALQ